MLGANNFGLVLGDYIVKAMTFAKKYIAKFSRITPSFQFLFIFTKSVLLGRFSHKVAMSVCLCVYLRHQVQFFSRPAIGPQVT